MTVGPYQVGIIIWDGMVLDVFSGGTQPLPRGDVETYIASTAPFNLAFWLKVPWESSEPNDLVLDPPLVTADGKHVTGRIDLTLSVTTKDVDETLVTSEDSHEGAHRLLQLLGLYGETITTSDVADIIKRELLPKLLALDFSEYKADELRSNRDLQREFSTPLETELSLTIDHFGLQLVDFHFNWNIDNRKPLHHRELHQSGVKSNKKEDRGSTPLHGSAFSGDTKTVPPPVSVGADINARRNGSSTLLHQAALIGDTKTILTLVSAGADVHARDEASATPLHLAAKDGHAEAALALVSAGADIHAKSDGGVTPLHQAAREGQTETALALISAGADIHARNIAGGTPLHWAVRKKKAQTALALVSAGADIHARDDDGTTPLDMAAAMQGRNTPKRPRS